MSDEECGHFPDRISSTPQSLRSRRTPTRGGFAVNSGDNQNTRGVAPRVDGNVDLDERALASIEASHPDGLTSQAILDALDGTRFAISEATLRKWVQLGLLPRSVRVGRKGKHQGSQGIYPVSVVRQIRRIKEMMSQDFTIEEIQREFLFARGDLEEAERTLARVIDQLDRAIDERAGQTAAKSLRRQLDEAREVARKLLGLLTNIESELTMQARLRRAAM